MGCSPSTTQRDPELLSKLAEIKANYQSIFNTRSEISTMRVKRIYLSSNQRSRDLRASAVIAKSLYPKVESVISDKSQIPKPSVHKASSSLAIFSQDLQSLSDTSSDLEQLLRTELDLGCQKSENLKSKLKNLQSLLNSKKTEFKSNLETIKDLLTVKKKVSHKKNFSEKFADSTFYTSGIECSYSDKNYLKSIAGLKHASQLSKELVELKGKILLRDEMKGLVEGFLERYSRSVDKVAELSKRVEGGEAEDGKCMDGELKRLKNRIYVLEKEIENDKQEQRFLKNILAVGKKFSEFELRTREIGFQEVMQGLD